MVTRYLLMGLVFGVGMPLFAALTAWLARRPDRSVLHYYFRLSLISGSLFIVCAGEVFYYLTVYTTMPRTLFVCCVAGGIGLGMFAVFLFRWRQGQNGSPESAGQGETRRYDWRITAVGLVAAFVLCVYLGANIWFAVYMSSMQYQPTALFVGGVLVFGVGFWVPFVLLYLWYTRHTPSKRRTRPF